MHLNNDWVNKPQKVKSRQEIEGKIYEELNKIKDIVLLYGGSKDLKNKAEILEKTIETLISKEVNRFWEETDQVTISRALEIEQELNNSKGKEKT